MAKVSEHSNSSTQVMLLQQFGKSLSIRWQVCLSAVVIAFCLVFNPVLLSNFGISTGMIAPAHAGALTNATDLVMAEAMDLYGEDWNDASAADQLRYCRQAYTAFRAAPAQSYIISSNVQSISPEGFCRRLDQFYSFEMNIDTPLGEAAAIAPLLFSDVSMEFELE